MFDIVIGFIDAATAILCLLMSHLQAVFRTAFNRKTSNQNYKKRMAVNCYLKKTPFGLRPILKINKIYRFHYKTYLSIQFECFWFCGHSTIVSTHSK